MGMWQRLGHRLYQRQSDLTVVALYTEVIVNIYIYVGNGLTTKSSIM
jgi:hypothetical protein